jgi:hypothetical protein
MGVRIFGRARLTLIGFGIIGRIIAKVQRRYFDAPSLFAKEILIQFLDVQGFSNTHPNIISEHQCR